MVLKTVRYALRLDHKVNGLIQREAKKMTSLTSKAVTEFAKKYAEAYAHALKISGTTSAQAHELATAYMVNGFAKAGK